MRQSPEWEAGEEPLERTGELIRQNKRQGWCGARAHTQTLHALSCLTSGFHVTPASTADDCAERKMNTRKRLA